MNTFEDQIVVYNTVETFTVVSQGAPGPKGDTGIAEALVTFSKRIEFVTDNLILRGEAAVGSLDSDSTWRIRRIIVSDENVTEAWADGTALFDKVWNNRLAYSYI